jgi:hypothetical protein
MADTEKLPIDQKTSGVKALEVSRDVGALRRAYYQSLVQAPERGQFVAWTMLIVPYEILAAGR